MNLFKIVRPFALCLSLFLMLAAGSFAQQPATGVPPFGSFSGGPFDTVNNANLNVHLQVPVVNKAGRGQPFYYILGYDNSLWSPTSVSGQKVWTPVGAWGWSGITDGATGYVTSSSVEMQGECYSYGEYYPYSYTQYSGFVYHDPSGTSHWFSLALNTNPEPTPPYGCQPSPPSGNEQGSAQATDGSGYTLNVNLYNQNPASIEDVSGKTITPPLDSTSGSGSVIDNNGNMLTATASGGAMTFTDTLGKTALSVSGTNPVTLTYTDFAGSPSSVALHYSTYTVRTNFGCSGIS